MFQAVFRKLLIMATIIAYKGNKIFVSMVLNNLMIYQDRKYFIFELNIQFFWGFIEKS